MANAKSALVFIVFVLGAPITSIAEYPEVADLGPTLVLTPTRLRQSLADTPAGVTILTTDMLERFSITSIPEALRFVPGMAVTRVSGSDYRINYHGTNILSPRRMNILVDGMSVYRAGLALADWLELPVSVDDIDRIEVTRGPSSAAYGPNSMLAVINIITKHPAEGDGTTLIARGGSRTAQGVARFGGSIADHTRYRLTIDHQYDRGFDGASRSGQDHDSVRLDKLTWRSITDIDGHSDLDIEGVLIRGITEKDFIQSGQITFPDIDVDHYYLNARWRRSLTPDHDLQIQTYLADQSHKQRWTSCLPTATFLPELFQLWKSNPAFVNTLLAGRVPAGGSVQDNALAAAAIVHLASLGPRAAIPTCANANQNIRERRYDLELQDTLVYSNELRAVSGLGIRRDIDDSETFFAGSVANTSWRGFANVEYKPLSALSINAGGYFEHDQLSGSSFSPRIAINAHVDEENTFRVVVSKAARTPNFLEQRADWSYRATDFSPAIGSATEGHFFASATSPGGLQPEIILSKEIGYFGNFPSYGLMVDAKIFDDRLKHLISEKLQVFDFAPTNDNSARLRGAELQATYSPNPRWFVYGTYAYLLNHASTLLEQTQYFRHSGSVGASLAVDREWRIALALFGNTANSLGQGGFGREELTLTNTQQWGARNQLTTSLTVAHLEKLTTDSFIDFGQTAQSRYDSRWQFIGSAKLAF